jgi:hypothetical protein
MPTTSRYTARELLEDARGYGRVLYVAQGSGLAYVADGGCVPTRLASSRYECFVGELYAFVEIQRPVTLYRWYDEDPKSPAKRMGSWWSPHRPSAEIDPIALGSLHKTARSDLALKRSWNAMHSVVEADLAVGAQAYVGRAARQVEDTDEVHGGGYIQFFLPPWSARFLGDLRDKHWVR